ncbi:hypothetical protein ACTXK0_08570 [Corynebacterium variabile]|uniref:hypothetical protein n=1 Tax=Corynebacterium variabile TaxID=1727 RepID=UPI003FD30E9A
MASLLLLSACSGGDDGATPTFTVVETNAADTSDPTEAEPQPTVVDDGAPVEAESSDAASGTDRPASLTETGWSGSAVRCNYGDPWVYAAQGRPGQVVICLDGDELYAVDTGNPYGGDGAYAATSAVCPVSGTSRDRYVWHHADTGWTEYNGTTRYVMDIFSGRGKMDLTDTDNLVEDSYDGSWTNTEVKVPTLRWCQNAGDSPTVHLLS